MSYVFFSYTRNDAGNSYLKQFYDDLIKELRQKVGTIPATEEDGKVVFLDTEEIAVGADWKKELMDHLQGCRAFVCVYSPGYFNSEYCGREFAVFQQRLTAFNGAAPPPLIFPVLWEMSDRVKAAIEATVPGIQYTQGSFSKEYAEEGLCYLMRMHRDQYQKFLHYFTKTMVQEVTKYDANPVSELHPFPPIGTVTSAWKQAAGPLPQGPQSSGLSGAGTAQFYFVAGRGADYAKVRQQVSCYNDKGGRFWSPYHPANNQQAQLIAYKAADSAKANYDDVEVDAKLIDRIRDAEKNNTIVVLVVDPWSVKVQNYRQLLEACDSNAFLNCGVVIPWNPAENEPTDARDKLVAEMKVAFKRTVRLKHIYFRDAVKSADELEKELCTAILEIRTRLMQETQEVRPTESAQPNGETPAVVPIIHGPGGTKG